MPLFGGGGGRSRFRQEAEQEVKGADRSRGDFASGLTVQQLGLFQSQGYIPVGSVMGNSVFSMGSPAGGPGARGDAGGRKRLLRTQSAGCVPSGEP